MNYTTYALIQHICSLHVADFQKICSDYAVNFWEKEKWCTKNWQSSCLKSENWLATTIKSLWKLDIFETYSAKFWKYENMKNNIDVASTILCC